MKGKESGKEFTFMTTKNEKYFLLFSLLFWYKKRLRWNDEETRTKKNVAQNELYSRYNYPKKKTFMVEKKIVFLNLRMDIYRLVSYSGCFN